VFNIDPGERFMTANGTAAIIIIIFSRQERHSTSGCEVRRLSKMGRDSYPGPLFDVQG